MMILCLFEKKVEPFISVPLHAIAYWRAMSDPYTGSDSLPLISKADWTSLSVNTDDVAPPSETSHYVRPTKKTTQSTNVTIGAPRSFLLGDHLQNCHVVFPTGVYFKKIDNPNAYDVEINFEIGAGHLRSVLVQANSQVHDVTVIPCPADHEPLGQRWCERFGVLTEKLLERGIVERRKDGCLVVWRTFRHTPSKQTPFGIWKECSGNSRYTVFTSEEYRQMCEECIGMPSKTALVSARPVFDNVKVSPKDSVELMAKYPYMVYHEEMSASHIGDQAV